MTKNDDEMRCCRCDRVKPFEEFDANGICFACNEFRDFMIATEDEDAD